MAQMVVTMFDAAVYLPAPIRSRLLSFSFSFFFFSFFHETITCNKGALWGKL